MKRLLIASLSLPFAACYGGERYNTGECPAGETCSDLTPHGLKFIGNKLMNDLLLSGPVTTAIGGTQAVALEYDRGDGIWVALDLPYSADDDGGIGVKVDNTSGSQVIVRGMGSRTNYLRILDSDGLLMDRKELTAAAVKKIELVPDGYERIPAETPIAFNAGNRKVGIGLWGDVQTSSGPRLSALVDTSMDLSLAGATRKAWDTLEINAVVGTSTLAVTAGDKPAANLDFVVVDHAESLTLQASSDTTVSPQSSAYVCFTPLTTGHYVAGLTWTFSIDAGPSVIQGDGTFQRNCISVSTQKTSGSILVEARAGGQTATATLTATIDGARVIDNSKIVVEPTVRATTRATPDGDRAALE